MVIRVGFDRRRCRRRPRRRILDAGRAQRLDDDDEDDDEHEKTGTQALPRTGGYTRAPFWS